MADELSLNATTELPGCALSGALTTCMSVAPCGAPSTTTSPRKNQWRECSLLDCAMSKSSTLVGSRAMSSRKRRV
jgi:hypothetical protein